MKQDGKKVCYCSEGHHGATFLGKTGKDWELLGVLALLAY